MNRLDERAQRVTQVAIAAAILRFGANEAEISTTAYLDDRDQADIEWVRAAEWLRIGWTLPSPTTP